MGEPIYRPSPKNPPYSPSHRNLCCNCGEDFASVEAFDKHRWGPQSRRQCVLAGLGQDETGRWNTPANTDIRSLAA